VRLQDKVVIITGAGAGIGRAAAVLFAREGARVACADRDPATGEETARLAAETGRETCFIQGDAAADEGVQRLVDETARRFGRLDGFFANAGVVPPGTVEVCTTEEWDRTMAVNARSVYLACKYGIPVMKAGGGGTFVCTASVAGVAGVKNRAAYSASKAAVLGLVKSVALDYVQENIRINAICPGTVDTPSLHARLQAMGDYEAALAQFIARQPMGRLGTADEIAALALYLASDESGYMTGSYLVIDGGLSL
jgi:NAD(P)-dependent dehydrogenase (short-subunit alcohol dehydrogenase family)